MVDWLVSLLLGMIQGLLEWLPVSSSGQTTLVLVDLLSTEPELAIALGLAVHIGTAGAVFARYPRHLARLASPCNMTPVKKFYWVTTAISLACGFPVFLVLENTFDTNLWTGASITLLVGAALLVTGLVIGRRPETTFRRLASAGSIDYTLVGLAQGIAVLPGISRSGMTLSALLARGFRETDALVFSFLLSVPVSLAAFGYVVLTGGVGQVDMLLLAALSSFVFGYISMGALVRLSRMVDFSRFCIILGLLTIALASAIWVLSP